MQIPQKRNGFILDSPSLDANLRKRGRGIVPQIISNVNAIATHWKIGFLSSGLILPNCTACN
jgi:hypothetical protein